MSNLLICDFGVLIQCLHFFFHEVDHNRHLPKENLSLGSWVKVFRIIPEFKILNSTDYIRFSDLYSVCLKTIDHLSFKL